MRTTRVHRGTRTHIQHRFTEGLRPGYHTTHILGNYRRHLIYLMAQDGLMHQPSVAVQPNPRVTPAPHRSTSPIPSEKWPGCRRGLRSSREGGSHAAAPSLWEALVPGPSRALQTLRPGSAVWATAASGAHHTASPSLPQSGALEPLSPTLTPVRPPRVAPAASAQLRETGSTPGDGRGPQPLLWALGQLVTRCSASSTLPEELRAVGGAGAWDPGSCALFPPCSPPPRVHPLRSSPPSCGDSVTIGDVISEVYFRRFE